MPTRKIADFNPCKDNGTWNAARMQCRDPQHQPPSMMYYSPGVWEHTCPGCGRVTTFTVHPTHLCTKENVVVQPQVRPVECVVHRPTGTHTGRSTEEKTHEAQTCSSCGEQAYRHHVC